MQQGGHYRSHNDLTPTIPRMIRNGAIAALKEMDAIFLAVSVNAVPVTQGIAYKS